MKKSKFLVATLAVIGLTALFYSCEEAVADAVADTCMTSSSGCGGSFTACSNGTSSWYTYNGKRYSCASGGDCTAAATALANDMCGRSEVSDKEFDIKVQKILNTYPTNAK